MAHNVDEDNDLVISPGHGTATDRPDPTIQPAKKANCRAWPWIKQRSTLGFKGYALTYAVHKCAIPRSFGRELADLGVYIRVQLIIMASLSAIPCWRRCCGRSGWWASACRNP